MARVKSVLKFFDPRKILTSRRNIIAAVIVIIVLGFFLWPKPKGEPLQYEAVKRGDIYSSISASGVLDGKDDITLHFNSAGKLGYINFKQGDKIKKGDQVAGLDVQALNITLQQAQNNLTQAQAAVDKTLDDIHLSQYGNGGFGNVGTGNETETQKQARVTAQTNRDNAADSVKAAQRAFQDAVLYAPFGGVVIQANPVPGQNVTAADTIVQISDDSQIVFAADVDESDLSNISLNQPVQVTLNAYSDQTFNGLVQEITPLTKTTTSGATVVTIKVDLQNPQINFVVGLNGQADIITKEAKNVLIIPLDGLRDDNTVYVKNGNNTKLVSVQPGIRSDTEVEITSGLNEDDQVVMNPQAVPSPKANSGRP